MASTLTIRSSFSSTIQTDPSANATGPGSKSSGSAIDSCRVTGSIRASWPLGGTEAVPGPLWAPDPVDGPFADFRNADTYREECRRSMILGCVGKWAIHPSQIDHALEIYSPKPEDVARARKLEKAYADAEAKGLGAINVDGVMVDVASIRILRNTILNKADLYGM